MPEGNVSKETCGAKHEALGIEIRDLKEGVKSMNTKLWALLLSVAGLIGTTAASMLMK